jgi:hypothetical protein
MIEFMAHDDCCSKHFSRACKADLVNTDAWTCSKCGCEWRAAEVADAARTWTPIITAEIIRVRG